ncbi:hypothetical protein HELRODRAFT_155996 [Helobdella robusta]|uniref:Alpha-galactosidase n=1 Tax=Helobdella robusta TaxID=6412 RepID=T1ELQ6_HELRO|nr:hypothetical protein HELRODRAFT_155996 [Helobdella robusta]ESN96192.1 hypothetical protein HELRODRAFT_155996 [Helobdella robusta]
MGWLSWERYRCMTDCVNYPDDCISEKLFKNTADQIVDGGYKDAGYEYVMIDDCWQAQTRDGANKLQPDPDRFPNGIKYLADYIHKLGLKFGIYSDVGDTSCAGFPGTEYHFEEDAQTFADWTIDFLKLDGCYYDMDNIPPNGVLPESNWPPDWLPLRLALLLGIRWQAAKHCNSWRNCHDIDDSWDSLLGIVNCEGDDKTHFLEVAGPGNFNDADIVAYSLSSSWPSSSSPSFQKRYYQ